VRKAEDDRLTAKRFLLIKACGDGFWHDLEHVVGALLIAEMADRIPVVYWGKNSIYGGSEHVNAFEQFFRPVSGYTVHDLMREDYTVCPAIWNVHNLVTEENRQWIRTWRYPLEVMLSRPENILVLGWAPLYYVFPWLQKPHPVGGASLATVYRYIFEKYFRLQSEVAREINDFYHARMAGSQILALHVRGSDKVTEVPNIRQINKLYFAEIETYVAAHPAAKLFLLTESAEILAEYRDLYRKKLIYTACQRTGDDAPLYFQEHTQKIRLGIEVLKDVYLALRCDAFRGNLLSNVSQAIARLKSWPPDRIKLLAL